MLTELVAIHPLPRRHILHKRLDPARLPDASAEGALPDEGLPPQCLPQRRNSCRYFWRLLVAGDYVGSLCVHTPDTLLLG